MAIDLVTLAEYKAYSGINSVTQDAEITAIIPKVSALVKNLCRRTFVDYVSVDKVETFAGGSKLYPKEYPVTSITSLGVSYDYGTTYTNLVSGTDYVIDKEDESVAPTGTEFPRMINGYKLTYKGGFSPLPEDLKVAVLDLVRYYLKNDSSVHSNKAPGTNSVQIEYVTSTSLPSHIRRVLDLYVGDFL